MSTPSPLAGGYLVTEHRHLVMEHDQFDREFFVRAGKSEQSEDSHESQVEGKDIAISQLRRWSKSTKIQVEKIG